MLWGPEYKLAQLRGDYGLYALGTADRALEPGLLSLSFVKGEVIRFKWESIEPAPGKFNWNYIDQELISVKTNGKKAVLQMLGAPLWLRDSLGALVYYYVDKNTYHSTYGDTLFSYIPWSETYLSRLEIFIRELGKRYAADTTVSYVNAVSASISRNLPEKIADGRTFWEAFNYKADTLITKMKRVLDVYMSSFPNTPLWSSMDYISFESRASGKSVNYVCSEYAAYGVSKYGSRFGVWREDISGCTLYPPNSGSQWNVMKTYSDRTGAQMLWSVQDGPTRMNQCGLNDTTKFGVMKAALDKGLLFGMRYFEIYTADIKDIGLHSLFKDYDGILKSKYSLTSAEQLSRIPDKFSLSQNYPNPFNPTTTLEYTVPELEAPNISHLHIVIRIYDVLGKEVTTLVDDYKLPGSYSVQFTAINLPSGIYCCIMRIGNLTAIRKMVLLK